MYNCACEVAMYIDTCLFMQIKDYRYYALTFVGGVVACFIVMILMENDSLKNQIQSLKVERQKLMSQVNDKRFRQHLQSFDEVENHFYDVIV